MIVRSCFFSNTAVEAGGDRNELHHCRFVGRDRVPLEFSGAGGSVHHNEIRLENAKTRFAIISPLSGRVRMRVFNNLITGALYESNSNALNLSGPIDFVHNTVVLLRHARPAQYPVVQVTSSFAMVPKVSNNIIVNLNDGILLRISGSHSPFHLDLHSNLYFASRTSSLFSGSNAGSHANLSSWQNATGQDRGV